MRSGKTRFLGGALLCCFLAGTPLRGQARALPAEDLRPIYQRLRLRIGQIKLFDDHSHPGFADDSDVDAMAAPPGSQALRTRADNPELIAAARSLFRYPFADNSPKHAQWLIAKKEELRRSLGPAYFSSILDKLNIETVVANRVAMPDYLDRRRFLWAFFVDSFLFPFDNSAIRSRNADEGVYLPLQEKLMRREMRSAGMDALPETFDGYLKFITSVLERDQQNGAVAMKFEAAYFRPLHFADPPLASAGEIYAKYRGGGVPRADEYRRFQDYVFRYLLREAGRLRLVVQIHTAVGIGDFFSLHDGNVLNLENVLRDPRYDNVNFVLLHGGYPYERQAIWLAARKNVYIDSSLTDLYLYPSEFKAVLKHWLTIFPEKVVFGTDAFPFNEALGAEEAYWLSVNSTREALAGALAELVSEKAFTETQALKIARGYLHDNAAALFGRDGL
jgi:hypothetical protein